MGYILSVDGGGSKTLYCLYEIENDYKEYIRGDSTNYKNVGIDVVKSNLEKNINEIRGISINIINDRKMK